MDTSIDAQRPHILDMLSALTGVAASREADELAFALFEALRTFRPSSPRVDAFEGWFCMRRGDFAGAARHLSAAADALGAEAGPVRALLAMVNCVQGDPMWPTQAQSVIDSNHDPASVALMHELGGMPGTPADAPRTAQPELAAAPAPAETANTVIRARPYLVRG